MSCSRSHAFAPTRTPGITPLKGENEALLIACIANDTASKNMLDISERFGDNMLNAATFGRISLHKIQRIVTPYHSLELVVS
jgi:hypothetical protein